MMFYVKFDENGYVSEFVEEEKEGYIEVPSLNCRLVNGQIVDTTELEMKKEQILKLKNLLLNTDYQAIKYAEGELTEEEYAPIKAQRKEWRSEINRLEEELKNGN